MAFVKWEIGLTRKREIIVLADRLGLHPHHVAGCAMALWEWAAEQTTTGVIPRCPLALLDAAAGFKGFAAALLAEDVQWLHFDEATATVTFPHWERHNSQGAKSRALSAVRQSTYRERNGEALRALRSSVTRVTHGSARAENGAHGAQRKTRSRASQNASDTDAENGNDRDDKDLPRNAQALRALRSSVTGVTPSAVDQSLTDLTDSSTSAAHQQCQSLPTKESSDSGEPSKRAKSGSIGDALTGIEEGKGADTADREEAKKIGKRDATAKAWIRLQWPKDAFAKLPAKMQVETIMRAAKCDDAFIAVVAAKANRVPTVAAEVFNVWVNMIQREDKIDVPGAYMRASLVARGIKV